jgi:hypothetical protein
MIFGLSYKCKAQATKILNNILMILGAKSGRMKKHGSEDEFKL